MATSQAENRVSICFDVVQAAGTYLIKSDFCLDVHSQSA